jgi:hypothetical protein
LVSEVASLVNATITSIIEIVDVMAATLIRAKKMVQVTAGLNMCWNTACSGQQDTNFRRKRFFYSSNNVL